MTTLRDRLSMFTFPVLMGGFVALAAWGFGRGFDTTPWVVALTVLNFFVIVAFEQLLPRNPKMNLFSDRQSLNDIGHGILLAGLARPLGGALAILLLAQIADWRTSAWAAQLWPDGWMLPAQIFLGLVVWSFSDYWVHRSFHVFDRLWWFHSIHHDTPQMHILKSGRLHVGEDLLNAVLKPLPLLLVGAPGEVMVWIGLWTVFDGNLTHSNIDQRFPSWAHYFVPTVQLHNLHHAVDRRHQDSNFSGSSAIWDVIFGTFSHPDRCPLGPLGIENSPVPAGFAAQLAFPLRAQLKPPELARSDSRQVATSPLGG